MIGITYLVNLCVDLMWSAFCNIVSEAIDAYVPVYSVNTHRVEKRYPTKYVKQRHAGTISLSLT